MNPMPIYNPGDDYKTGFLLQGDGRHPPPRAPAKDFCPHKILVQNSRKISITK